MAPRNRAPLAGELKPRAGPLLHYATTRRDRALRARAGHGGRRGRRRDGALGRVRRQAGLGREPRGERRLGRERSVPGGNGFLCGMNTNVPRGRRGRGLLERAARGTREVVRVQEILQPGEASPAARAQEAVPVSAPVPAPDYAGGLAVGE